MNAFLCSVSFFFLEEVAAYELKQKEAEEKKERLYVFFSEMLIAISMFCV